MNVCIVDIGGTSDILRLKLKLEVYCCFIDFWDLSIFYIKKEAYFAVNYIRFNFD